MKGLGKLAVLLTINPLMLLYEAFVVSKLWEWFVLPITGIHISTVYFAGMMMIINIVKLKIPKKGSEIDNINYISFAIVYYSITLLFGWVFSLML